MRNAVIDHTSTFVGLDAENLVGMYHISRREQERFALRGHQKAVAAQEEETGAGGSHGSGED